MGSAQRTAIKEECDKRWSGSLRSIRHNNPDRGAEGKSSDTEINRSIALLDADFHMSEARTPLLAALRICLGF